MYVECLVLIVDVADVRRSFIISASPHARAVFSIRELYEYACQPVDDAALWLTAYCSLRGVIAAAVGVSTVLFSSH